MSIRYQMHSRHARRATFHLLYTIVTWRQFYKIWQGEGYQLGYEFIAVRPVDKLGSWTAAWTWDVMRIVTL